MYIVRKEGRKEERRGRERKEVLGEEREETWT